MCLICRELRNPCTLVQVTEDYLRPFFLPLRIPTGKKHPKIKLKCLRKIRILTFGSLVHEINSFQEVLKLEHIFKKNYVVTGKTPLFVIGPFCSHNFIFLTLVSDRQSSFEWKWCVFSISGFN